MVKVRLPDGRVASFPDDMAREQIKAFVAQKYPNAYGEQSMPEFSPEALAQIEAGNRAYDDKSHLGWNVAGGFVSGMGEGNLSGIGRVASGLTFGASDWLDRKTGGNLAALDDRLQRRADAAGLGLANRIAKAGTEIVGNVAPSAAITRGLARAGVKSALGQAAAGGGIGGALYGATASDTLSELPVNTIVGGVGGTVGGAALHSAISGIGTVGGLLRSNVKKGMDYLRSKFGDAYVDDMIREAEQKGVSLAEVADDRALKAVQMARQQTSTADDIVTQNAQAIRDNVSNKNTDTLNDMFGTKSGYRMAQEAEQAAMDKARPMFNDLEAYGDLDPLYVKPGEKVPTGKLSKEQADALLKQEMGKLPTREQLTSYPAESKFNPNNYTKEQAEQVLRNRVDKAGLDIYNDELSNLPNAVDDRLGVNHLLGKERNPYVRTINNTLNKPDVKFTSEGREFNAKKYKNSKTGKDFMDWIITENGDIVSKYPTTTNHIANQIKKSSQNMSLRGDIPVSYDGVTYTQLPNGTTDNIPSLGAVVNSNNVINSVVKSVKGAYSSLKGLPDTDARVILETRKLLSSQTKSPDATLAYQAKQALKEFDDALPADFRKGLEEANKIYKIIAYHIWKASYNWYNSAPFFNVIIAYHIWKASYNQRHKKNRRLSRRVPFLI